MCGDTAARFDGTTGSADLVRSRRGRIDHGRRSRPEAPLSAFTHVVATYDGTTLELYINGSKVDSSSAPAPSLASPTTNFVIGCSSTKLTDFFAGVIDEVAVYVKALPAARVQAHFAAAQR